MFVYCILLTNKDLLGSARSTAVCQFSDVVLMTNFTLIRKLVNIVTKILDFELDTKNKLFFFYCTTRILRLTREEMNCPPP